MTPAVDRSGGALSANWRRRLGLRSLTALAAHDNAVCLVSLLAGSVVYLFPWAWLGPLMLLRSTAGWWGVCTFEAIQYGILFVSLRCTAGSAVAVCSWPWALAFGAASGYVASLAAYIGLHVLWEPSRLGYFFLQSDVVPLFDRILGLVVFVPTAACGWLIGAISSVAAMELRSWARNAGDLPTGETG